MRITRDKNLVEFVPDGEVETDQLQQLWNIVVDCSKFNKKLVAVGEYIPTKNNVARFVIEGQVDDPPVYASEDARYWCNTCNKYINVEKGKQVPYCCGKVMELMD